jgi:transportin-3
LDLQSRQSLLNSIVALLYTHRHSSKAMVTQLVLAMADLSALLLDYVDPIGLMIQTYSQDPDMISIILEFLTVLPEEVHDNRFLTNEVSC